MRYLKIICGILLLCNNAFCQEANPIRIAVPHFLPPFTIEGASHKLSGFDITFMTRLCEEIQEKCLFVPMATDQIIPSVNAGNVDLGIGAITITVENYKYVDFTIPYMLSESRFLGKQKIDSQKFIFTKFKDQIVGAQTGTTHEQELLILGFTKEHIQKFLRINSMIDALNNDQISLALVSNPIAIYWENYSANKLHVLGKPLNYGLGFGVAVKKNNNRELVRRLNTAILLFQQSPEYRQLYQMYFGEL